MNNRGSTAIKCMQISIRPIVLGTLLAFTAMSVHAQPKAVKIPVPNSPAATPEPAPIDLSLHPASAPLSASFNSAPFNSAPLSSARRISSPSSSAPASSPLGNSGPVNSATAGSSVVDPALPSASTELQRVARWVSVSGDNGGLPYLLVDKVNARVFVFDSTGQLQGTAPALLGMAHGDRLLVPNDTTMTAMKPQDRVTPAARFVSRLAIDSHGKELLVLDYDASISLHAVVKGTPAERRAERLNSPTTQDNRISFGCINVPTAFYSSIVSPTFTHTKGIVYVLPETGPASGLFGFNPGGVEESGAQPVSTALNARTAQTVQAPEAGQPVLAQ